MGFNEAAAQSSGPLQSLLAESGALHDARRGGFAPGASLLLVAKCEERGISLAEPNLGALAHHLRLSPAELQEVIAFYRAMVQHSGGSAAPVLLCLGTSCKLRGAAKLHGDLREHLANRGANPPSRDVFCLGQCDRGPSVMIGSRIFCAGEQRVVCDDRGWRRGTSEPLPISTEIRPIQG